MGGTKGEMDRSLSFRNIAVGLVLFFPLPFFIQLGFTPKILCFSGGTDGLSRNTPFYSLEGGIWWLLIRPDLWKDSRLWLAVVCFVVLPFFAMGNGLICFSGGIAPANVYFYLCLKSVLERPSLREQLLSSLSISSARWHPFFHCRAVQESG